MYFHENPSRHRPADWDASTASASAPLECMMPVIGGTPCLREMEPRIAAASSLLAVSHRVVVMLLPHKPSIIMPQNAAWHDVIVAELLCAPLQSKAHPMQ